MSCKGVPVALGLRLEPVRRRAVVFAPLWFIDATGLGALLRVGGRPAVRFGDTFLLPIKRSAGVGEVELAMEGQKLVMARVPSLGATEVVTLLPHHAVVLRTERISVSETFDVPCALVSLLPRYMFFNQTSGSVVAFRQEGMSSVEDVGPGRNAMFFFAPTARQRLEFAPAGCTSWSPSFELADHTIGAYPIATSHGPMCLKISREGGVFSATVDSQGCHEIRNEHKSLIVEVRPDGDCAAAVVARPGGTRPFASRDPFQRGTTAVLHLTRLGGGALSGTQQAERLQIDVHRHERLELRVGGLPVTVTVATTKRVAVVTVRPRAWQEATVERVDFSIRLKTVAFAIVGGEKPRCERFGGRLENMDLLVEQEKEDTRAMSLRIGKLQVDRLHPRPDVLLASVRQPFLSGQILREDCNSSHVLLSSGELTIGELEAAIDDETVRQICDLLNEAVQEPPGLQLCQIQRRAAEPYPQSCQGPPELPPTFVLRSLVVYKTRLRVWARLQTVNTFLPQSIMWLTRLTGLGVSVLQLDGAVFSVPQLRFFQYSCLFGRPDPPFVGSARGLIWRIAEKYIPELSKCWQSVVSNSNIMFGGILTRQFWLPRNRKVPSTCGGLCKISAQGSVE